MPTQKEPELTPDPRENATKEELDAARQVIAELVIEAMEVLIETGKWDPREGIAGLERLLDPEYKRRRKEREELSFEEKLPYQANTSSEAA